MKSVETKAILEEISRRDERERTRKKKTTVVYLVICDFDKGEQEGGKINFSYLS